MFDRLTRQAKAAFGRSRMLAPVGGHDEIGADHVLAGVLADSESAARRVLARLGVPPARVRPAMAGPHSPAGEIVTPMPFTAATRCALELSLESAQRLGHDHIGTGHVLLGLARCGDPSMERLRRAIADDAAADAALAAEVAAWANFPDERGGVCTRVRRWLLSR